MIREAIRLFLVASVMYFGTHVAFAQTSLLDFALVEACAVALAICVAMVVDHPEPVA